jgi:NAD(P)-dependent dehydrogenase (short-subunit alcohol dehydrogenase family)
MPTAVVTGAASGMGHATAEMYLARGWQVLGVDITPDLGIRHDGKTGRWTYTGWKIVDVSQLELQLKSEFNASNRDLYRPEAIKRASP